MTEQRLKLRGDGRSRATVEPFARNIVIRAPKSILLQCNKSNCGLIFSVWRALMATPLPVVLIPGLNCSARLYAEQIPALWRFGPVQVADHTRANTMDLIAAQILAAAPPRFALAGLSMGGYLALSSWRKKPSAPVSSARAELSSSASFCTRSGARRTMAGNTGADRASQAADRARRKRPVRRGDGTAVSIACASQPAGR